MRIGEFREFAVKVLPKRKRLLIVGKPGVGKTDAFGQACEVLGWEMIVQTLPLDDPSTIRGYPRAPKEDGGDASHCLFDGMAKAFRADKPTLLLFDDIGQASESTLKAVMRIIQSGELDGKRLPECVTISAATNDVGHGAGVYGMIEPLKSRFHSIIDVETSVDDVVVYGLSRNWPADLLAYLRNSAGNAENPLGALHDWKPSKSMHVDGACPRSWEYVADWINDGIDDPEVIAGCVGKGRATEYLAFRRLVNDLPDVDAILLDPDSAPVPENPSARLLVSMALSSRMTAGNFGQCVTYLKRLPQMFRAYGVRDAFRAEKEKRDRKALKPDHKPLSASRDFTAWACSSDGKDILSATN